MAAALAGMISSSAWYTIAQRHKLSSPPQQIHSPVAEDGSLARAQKKRNISSSQLGSQASESSSSGFIPVGKRSKTNTSDDSVPTPATETLEEALAKAVIEYHEELDREEQSLAQQHEQQDTEQQTQQAPHAQAEPIPAQQDEQQGTEQQTHPASHEQAEPIPAQQHEQQSTEQQTQQAPHAQAEPIPAQQDEQQGTEQQTHPASHEQAEPVPAQQHEQQNTEQQTHQAPHEQAEPIPAQQHEQQSTEQQTQQAPHEQAEPVPAQQHEQQNTEQQTHQAPHEQAEPHPAQQDEQHTLDPLEALLAAHEEDFERQEKKARQAEKDRQHRLVFSAFGTIGLHVHQRQQTLHQFVAPKPPDLSAEPPTTPPPPPAPKRQVIDLEDQVVTPANPARKRLRWKQADPPTEKGSVEPPPEAGKDCDEHVDTGENSEPEDPNEDDTGKKRKWGKNKRGDSISIYRKLEAIKQYEELVEEHGKKVGSQMFYALKLPGQSMYICKFQRKKGVTLNYRKKPFACWTCLMDR